MAVLNRRACRGRSVLLPLPKAPDPTAGDSVLGIIHLQMDNPTFSGGFRRYESDMAVWAEIQEKNQNWVDWVLPRGFILDQDSDTPVNLDPQQCFQLQGQLSGMDRYSSPLLLLVTLCTVLPGSGTPGYKEMEPQRWQDRFPFRPTTNSRNEKRNSDSLCQ